MAATAERWQQGCPIAPHTVQAKTPLGVSRHAVPLALHTLLGQQGCPGPPRVPHDPAGLHVAPPGKPQVAPTAMHVGTVTLATRSPVRGTPKLWKSSSVNAGPE